MFGVMHESDIRFDERASCGDVALSHRRLFRSDLVESCLQAAVQVGGQHARERIDRTRDERPVGFRDDRADVRARWFDARERLTYFQVRCGLNPDGAGVMSPLASEACAALIAGPSIVSQWASATAGIASASATIPVLSPRLNGR